MFHNHYSVQCGYAKWCSIAACLDIGVDVCVASARWKLFPSCWCVVRIGIVESGVLLLMILERMLPGLVCVADVLTDV